MCPAKCNVTIMDKATGLISSLLAPHPETCFCQSQHVQYTHNGVTFVLLYVPVLFANNEMCQFALACYGFSVAVLTIVDFTFIQKLRIAYSILKYGCVHGTGFFNRDENP